MNKLASDDPFESFNARALSPSQVASGFVPPNSFQKLCKRRHTIVAGPRGSGKTTLLKMLQVSALRYWNHAEAESFRAQIDFTGVFIPADRSWGAQLSAIGKDFLEPEQAQLLGVGAFTTHVLKAVITAVIDRINCSEDIAPSAAFRYFTLSAEKEALLARATGTAWHLKLDLPTLSGIRLALANRLSVIHEIASRCSIMDAGDRTRELLGHDFLHLNFLSAVPEFLDIFEEVTQIRDERWALMFDELELAPESIRKSLTAALRSVDSRLLFKLAIAPFSRELEEHEKAASDKNDFDLVRLWYAAKEEGYPFSRSLIRQILARRGFPDIDPARVFGLTEDDASSPKRRKAAKSEYQWLRTFQRLEKADQTFSAYLSERGIDLRVISSLTENERAAIIRKVTPLVIVRDSFRVADGTRNLPGGQRSRKAAAHIYCGLPALLALCEGNPRWLIGLVDSMLDQINMNEQVSPSVQYRELEALLSRFCAFLRTIPCPGVEQGGRATSVLGMIDTIGEKFSREVIVKPFNPDPPGTFTIDSHASDTQLRSLEQAVYAGAVILVPESNNEVAIGSLRGKRFRLAYLLAPKYKLPLVLLRATSLSTLLSKDNQGQHQGGLFS